MPRDKVTVAVEYDREAGEVLAACDRCGHTVIVSAGDGMGHEDGIVDVACAILRDTCPKGQDNWYVAKEPS